MIRFSNQGEKKYNRYIIITIYNENNMQMLHSAKPSWGFPVKIPYQLAIESYFLPSSFNCYEKIDHDQPKTRNF